MIKRSTFLAAAALVSLLSFSLAKADTSSHIEKTEYFKQVSSILSFRRTAKINSFKTKEIVDLEIRMKKEAEEKAKKKAEEKAKKEVEEKAKKEAEEKAKKEAEEKAKKEVEEKAKKDDAEKARKEAEERSRKAAEQQRSSDQPDTSESDSYPERSTEKLYDLQTFMFNGVINWQGLKFTYYSQSVLPGGGLEIPGRHVNNDGYVSDGDGYIVLAGSAPKGTVYDTPFGYQGKIYDRGTVGNHLDVYIR